MARRTIIQSISFQPDVWNYLKDRSSISGLVNQAVRDYRKTKTTPELKIKQLKEKRKEAAKQIYQFDEEIKMLKEK